MAGLLLTGGPDIDPALYHEPRPARRTWTPPATGWSRRPGARRSSGPSRSSASAAASRRSTSSPAAACPGRARATPARLRQGPRSDPRHGDRRRQPPRPSAGEGAPKAWRPPTRTTHDRTHGQHVPPPGRRPRPLAPGSARPWAGPRARPAASSRLWRAATAAGSSPSSATRNAPNPRPTNSRASGKPSSAPPATPAEPAEPPR
jgi:hypothetical protein